MACTSCGEQQKNEDKNFTKAVVEINNPEQLILLRKVVMPATITEEENPPVIGKYRNVILQYEDTGHVYLYSSDGIPTAIESNVPQEVLDQIADLEEGLATETSARGNADVALGSRIDGVTSALVAETAARQNADTALSDRVTTIEEKIPTQASAQNQLADKDFVNSSVATNTANYISNNGQPFNSFAELEAYSGTLTNNDYAFVVGTDQAGNTIYTRYKYVASAGEWAEEYVLNNSSFTAAQWAAINSNITSGNVAKLNSLANIQTIGANLTLTNGELSVDTTTIAEKSDIPTVVQTTGTSSVDVMSQNAVTSMVFADPGGKSRVQIGDGAYAALISHIAIGKDAVANSGEAALAIGLVSSARGSNSIAIGRAASTAFRADGSIAIGSGAKTTTQGQVDFGTSGSTDFGALWGYNNSNYRLLTGLYDPQSAHDAATKGYVDSVTPTITMQTTDPGEGQPLATNHFIAVYEP